MKKCTFCGELNQEKTIVCPRCGHPDPKLISDRNRFPRPDPRAPINKFSTNSTLKKKPFLQNKYLIIILGILVVFSIFFITIVNTISNIPLENLIRSLATPTFTITPSTEPTLSPTPTQNLPQTIVATSSLKIRNGPGTNFETIGTLRENEVVNVIGRDTTSSWIKINLNEGGEGWISALETNVKMNFQISLIPLITFSPLTGIIQSLKQTGNGEFEIDNNSNFDALIILTRKNETITAAYVRQNESYTIKGIPIGDYMVYFSEGTDWNGNIFNNVEHQGKFVDSFTYKKESNYYTIWKITLKETPSGNAKSIDVNDNNFPSFTPNASKEE
jgi:uncharacterized protein YgiM (DUF1202 family)